MNGFIVNGQFAIEGRGAFVVWHTPEGLAVWVMLADASGRQVCAATLGDEGKYARAHAAFARFVASRVDQAVRNRTVRDWRDVVLTHDEWSFCFRWHGAHLLVSGVAFRDSAVEPPALALVADPESAPVPSVLEMVPELPLVPSSVTQPSFASELLAELPLVPSSVTQPSFTAAAAETRQVPARESGRAPAFDRATGRRFEWEHGAVSEPDPEPHDRASRPDRSGVRLVGAASPSDRDWLEEDLLRDCS